MVLSDEQKRKRIESAMRDVMETLGLDLTDDSLCDTPNAYCENVR